MYLSAPSSRPADRRSRTVQGTSLVFFGTEPGFGKIGRYVKLPDRASPCLYSCVSTDCDVCIPSPFFSFTFL